MVTPRAYISGSLGRALYLKADKWWVADLGLEHRPAHSAEVSALLSRAAEFNCIDFSSVEDVSQELQTQVEFSNLLFLVLRVLDPKSSLKSRLTCAQVVEPALSNPAAYSRLTDRLLSAPLELSARSAKGKTLSLFASFAQLSSLLRLVYDAQSYIDEALAAWTKWTIKFTDEELLAELVEEGAISEIVRACQAPDLQAFNLAMLTLIQRKRRAATSLIAKEVLLAVRADLKLVFFAKHAAQQGTSVSPRTHRKDLTASRTISNDDLSVYNLVKPIAELSSFETKSRVDKQLGAIRAELLAGKPAIVQKYVEELIRFQLDHSEREHLAKSLCSLASFSISANQLDIADQLSKDAVSLGVADVVVYTTRAEVLKNLGQFDAALSAYREARSMFPESGYTWNGVADVLKELGRFDQSLAAYMEAQTEFPESSVPRNGYVATLRAQGKLRMALEAAKIVANDFPEDPVSISTYASALAANGKYRAAISEYNKLIDYFLTDARPLFGYLRAMNANGQQIDALQKLQSLHTRSKDSLAISVALISQLRVTGKTDDAINLSREMLASAPGYTPIKFQLAASLVTKGNFEEAISYLPQGSLRSEADFGGYRIYLISLLINKQYARARDLSQDVIKNCVWLSWRAHFQTLLGFALFKLKKAAEATRILQVGLDLLDMHAKQSRLVIIGAAQRASGRTATAATTLNQIGRTSDPAIVTFKDAALRSNRHNWQIPAKVELDLLLAA